MKLILTFILLLIFSRIAVGQLDSIQYRQFLKEIMKVESISKIFPNDSIFDNDKFIKYIKDSFPGVDSVVYETHKGNYGLSAYTRDSIFNFGIRKAYVFDTSKYYIISFLDLNHLMKGPEWWLFHNGKISRKRVWNETIVAKSYREFKRNYYEERYRRDGTLRYKGAYKSDDKIGTWIYYNRKGKKVKEHKYN